MTTTGSTHLSPEERATLSLGLAQGQSLRMIARVLGRAPSTLSRECARNTPRGQPYRASTAQTQAVARACQPRRPRKLHAPWVWAYVQRHLNAGCSPEQIAGRLRRTYPDDRGPQLSTEPIYAALSVLPRGALRRELLTALRQARQARRPRARGTDRRGQLPTITPLAARPAAVTSRQVPGHWEGDLLKGTRNGSAVGTLVERTTRLVLLARMDGTDAWRAYQGFTKKLRQIPAALRKTLTYDRGKEMAEHERLARRLAIRVFFADPHAPWPRGSNENTNGLLRQYLPKGTDLSGYTQRELNAIAHRLNTRPRKCLDFATPLEVYAQLRDYSPVALGT